MTRLGLSAWRGLAAEDGAVLWTAQDPGGGGLEVSFNVGIVERGGIGFVDSSGEEALALELATGEILRAYVGRWEAVSDGIAVYSSPDPTAPHTAAVEVPALNPVWSVDASDEWYGAYAERELGAPGSIVLDALGNHAPLDQADAVREGGVDCGDDGADGFYGRWNPWSTARVALCGNGDVWYTDAATGEAEIVTHQDDLLGAPPPGAFPVTYMQQQPAVDGDTVFAALGPDADGQVRECAWGISSQAQRWCTPLPLSPLSSVTTGGDDLPGAFVVLLARVDSGLLLIWQAGLFQEGAGTQRERIIALDPATGEVVWVWRNPNASLGAGCIPELSGPGFLYVQELDRTVAIDPLTLAD